MILRKYCMYFSWFCRFHKQVLITTKFTFSFFTTKYNCLPWQFQCQQSDIFLKSCVVVLCRMIRWRCGGDIIVDEGKVVCHHESWYAVPIWSRLPSSPVYPSTLHVCPLILDLTPSQLMTWLSCMTPSVMADLLYTDCHLGFFLF